MNNLRKNNDNQLPHKINLGDPNINLKIQNIFNYDENKETN